MTRLSVIVPCLGSSKEFESTLVSVLQNRPSDSEVLVVHREAYRDPYALAGEVRFMHAPTCDSIAALLNFALPHARGEFVHILAAGYEVSEGWTESALARFEEPELAAVAPVVVESQRGDRVLAAGVKFTSGGFAGPCDLGAVLGRRRTLGSEAIGPTLEAGFYRRCVIQLLEWDESLGDEFAAVDLALRFDRLGLTVCCDAESIVSAGANAAPIRPYTFSQARRAELLARRYSQRVSPLRHRLGIAGETLLAFPSPSMITGFCGRIAGMFGGVSELDSEQETAIRKVVESDLNRRRLAAQRSNDILPFRVERTTTPSTVTNGRRAA